MSEDIIFLHANKVDIQVDIPNALGKLSPCTIIWIRPLSDNIFEVSLKTKDDGYTIWLMRFEEDKSFTPLSCCLYVTEKERVRIVLADKLHCDGQGLRKQIYLERIKNFAGGYDDLLRS
jgi:hypothetical protein